MSHVVFHVCGYGIALELRKLMVPGMCTGAASIASLAQETVAVPERKGV
jgi:hypothetical protein